MCMLQETWSHILWRYYTAERNSTVKFRQNKQTKHKAYFINEKIIAFFWLGKLKKYFCDIIFSFLRSSNARKVHKRSTQSKENMSFLQHIKRKKKKESVLKRWPQNRMHLNALVTPELLTYSVCIDKPKKQCSVPSEILPLNPSTGCFSPHWTVLLFPSQFCWAEMTRKGY